MGNEMMGRGEKKLTFDATAKKFLVVSREGERNLQHSSRSGTATTEESSATRKKQDAEYISEFDREMEKYLKGGEPN